LKNLADLQPLKEVQSLRRLTPQVQEDRFDEKVVEITLQKYNFELTAFIPPILVDGQR